MTRNFYKTITLSLTGMLLALSSQFCLAGDEAPTAAELANATYIGFEEGPATLVEGRWEGEPYVEGGASRPSAGLVEDFAPAGDLNGDGSVILDVLQQGEGDAACCPSQLAIRTWSMVDGQLLEGEMEITGILSLDTLAGTEWVLTDLNRNVPISEEAEVSLAFAEGQISGISACNRYSAGVEQGEAPADLKIGPARSTRMACPGALMELENKYLDALTHVTGFSFLGGKLVLTWEKDDVWSTMLFAPVSKRL